ncbi:MAG: family metalloprotease protein [Massilia sp.]|nr:family metalloprotease protein [Massilia sp.]
MSIPNSHPALRALCHCQGGLSSPRPCRVPPAPSVLASMYMEYLRENNRRSSKTKLSFIDYLAFIGFVDPSIRVVGMDDRVLAQPAVGGDVQLLAVPKKGVQGTLRVIVLLVDFPDRLGSLSPGHYEDMLFSKDVHPTGSMRDYYAEVSNGKVDVVGTVHGWFRMPRKYSTYVNGESGTGEHSYPNNCQGLAEDAAKAAIDAGVVFPADLDNLQTNTVTALFIVHAGRGAEKEQTKTSQDAEIWSHKWNTVNPVEVGPNLSVATYLVVPQNCRLGVCAHELGHLAFQWQDFYDPNSNRDGLFWNGTGDWDLMASGCYNSNEASPAHPAVLHKAQHGWVALRDITQSEVGVTLKPTTSAGGRACRIRSAAFSDNQYLLLESRRLRGFDKHLPGEGLLVWRVDETKEMFAPATPGMTLVQADGRHELELPDPLMQGDDADPFPGSEGQTELSDTGTKASSSFPGVRSGIKLLNISYDPASGETTFDVIIDDAVAGKAQSPVLVQKVIGLQGNAQPKPLLAGLITAIASSVDAAPTAKRRASKAKPAPPRRNEK